MTYKCGTLVLTGVSDASTKHIQKLVSNQRVDTSKKWGTLKIPMTSARPTEQNRFLNRNPSSAYSESLGGNSMTISPHQDWRHQATRDIRHVELHPNPNQRYIRAGASLLDTPCIGPSSFYHQGTFSTPPLLWNIQHIEPASNTYERHIRSPPLLMNIQHVQPLSNSFQTNTRTTPLFINGVYSGPNSQSLHKNVRTVPLFIQNKIQTIVKTYSEGIPLVQFSSIFHKHFGFTIDFWRLGFSSLYEFLCSLDDVVVVNYFDGAWVKARSSVSGPPVYNGPVKGIRPIPETTDTTCQGKLPQGRAVQTGKSLVCSWYCRLVSYLAERLQLYVVSFVCIWMLYVHPSMDMNVVCQFLCMDVNVVCQSLCRQQVRNTSRCFCQVLDSCRCFSRPLTKTSKYSWWCTSTDASQMEGAWNAGGSIQIIFWWCLVKICSVHIRIWTKSWRVRGDHPLCLTLFPICYLAIGSSADL